MSIDKSAFDKIVDWTRWFWIRQRQSFI